MEILLVIQIQIKYSYFYRIFPICSEKKSVKSWNIRKKSVKNKFVFKIFFQNYRWTRQLAWFLLEHWKWSSTNFDQSLRGSCLSTGLWRDRGCNGVRSLLIFSIIKCWTSQTGCRTSKKGSNHPLRGGSVLWWHFIAPILQINPKPSGWPSLVVN